MSTTRPILLVEDEEHDVLFMKIALEQAEVDVPLQVARDGREAIAYLNGEGDFSNRDRYPLPRLVLLDLRLPEVPGMDVLRWIRIQPALVRIPVMIHSSSDQERDVDEAYRLGVQAYIVKRSDLRGLEEVVRRIKKYWLDADGPPPDCRDWLAVTVPPPFSNFSIRRPGTLDPKR